MENRLFSLPDDLIYKIYKIYFTDNIISQIKENWKQPNYNNGEYCTCDYNCGNKNYFTCDVLGYWGSENEFWRRWLKSFEFWENYDVYWEYPPPCDDDFFYDCDG